MRQAMFCGLLCLSLSAILVAQQYATGANTKPWRKFVGTWKEVPGPDSPSMLKVEPEGSGVKFSWRCKEDGSSCAVVVVANYDGKPYKNAGTNENLEYSYRKTEQTIEENGFLHGKQVFTAKWQLSPDGNTLTRTYHDTVPSSKDTTYVEDRSGGPVSKDDPFIGFWKRDWDKSDANVMTFAAKGDVFTVTGPGGIANERNCDGKYHVAKDRWQKGVRTVLYSCAFPDERTHEVAFKENGKVFLSGTSKISEDGKKMVRINKHADGKTTSENSFEKIE